MGYVRATRSNVKRANELFTDANNQLKQKLLKFLLSNVELYDKKLSYIVNDPYKSFIEVNKTGSNTSKSSNWCYLADVIQTAAMEYADDYVLKDLVETFELNGELLTV